MFIPSRSHDQYGRHANIWWQILLLQTQWTNDLVCSMLGAVQFLNVLILTLLCVQLFGSVKVAELPPVLKRAAYSACHL